MRGAWLGFAALLACAASDALAFQPQPPRYTREQMEAQLGETDRFAFVYGTQRAASTPILRERTFAIARRLFGGDSSQVMADRDATEETLAHRSVLLVGGPDENLWTRRLAPSLPVTFTARGFRWFGRDYERARDVLHLSYPSPLDPHRFVLLIAANSPETFARRGGGFYFGGDDWRIERDGEVVRSGRFAQSGAPPWRYDPALDRDRERERARFEQELRGAASGALTVRAPAELAGGEAVRARVLTLLASLDARGLTDASGAAPSLTLYRSLEQKGLIARNTRPEHLEADGSAHAALPAGRSELDLWSVAAQRLVRLGASRDSPLLEPAGAWLTGRLEGEPLERAIARLYFARLLPTARAAAARNTSWRSPLIDVPARSILVRALFESAGARGRRALLAVLAPGAPGTLDSLCRKAGVDVRTLERRYSDLADSLARSGQRSLAAWQAQPWRPRDGFQRGVCVAHSVSLERGYLSAACARELAALKGMGANWVSITPFGYLPSLNTPEIRSGAQGGVDEETDESVCEAAARARAIGLKVWLKPHLWTRGWVGQLDFAAGDWPRFFEQYRNFALHYALLAARERMDGYFVGHELTSATLAFPDRFRALIGDVRRVYPGTLSYEANWDREVEGIAFWDALDLVSVSFYFPLASAPDASPQVMAAGAAKALASLRAIAQRTGRPVLLGEVGYAPVASAPVRPWEESRAGPSSPETQRACYEAVVRALDPADWVAGAFWWKWYTSDETGGASDRSFTPRGKPAQAVMSRALRAWEGRPVRVLKAAAR